MSGSFSSPTTFYLQVRQNSIKLHVRRNVKNNRKTTVAYGFLFKNYRYLFSKSSKRVGHFQKLSFFSKTKRLFNDRFKKRLTTLMEGHWKLYATVIFKSFETNVIFYRLGNFQKIDV